MGSNRYSALLLFAASVLSGQFGVAQTINHAFQEGSTSSYNIVSLNSRSFYLEKTNRILDCCDDRISLVGRLSNGTFLFRTLIAVEAWMQDCMVSVATDKTLLVLAGTRMKGCDVSGTRYTICKADTNGNIIWTFTTGIDVDHILPWTSGFFLFSTDSILRYSSSGVLLGKTALGTNTVSAVARLGNSKIIYSYNGSSGPRFRVIDSTGMVVSDVSAPFVMDHITEGNGNKIYASSVYAIHRFSPSLVLLGSSTIPAVPSLSISDFVYYNDSIYVGGQTPGMVPRYVLLDSVFNVLHQSSTNLENAVCTGISVSASGKVNIVTAYPLTFQTYFKDHSFAGFFSLPKTGHLNTSHDIGVADIVGFYAYYLKGSQYQGVGNAQVRVRNFGNDTVTSFHLNHPVLIQGISYCYIGLEKEYKYTIPPGDSVTFWTGDFYLKPSYAKPPDTVNLSICIRSSVPNNQNDINTSNDQLCRTFSIIVGLPEAPPEVSLSVFPNPGSPITVTSLLPIERIQVLSPAGSILRTYEPQGAEVILREPAGLYLLRIESGDRVLFRKAVFVE